MARVLIVDQDPVAASIAQSIFAAVAPGVSTPYGIKSTVVGTAAAALALLHTLNFELLLVDLLTARDNEWAFLKDVRQLYPLFKLPIVIAAPLRSTSLEFDAVKYGANSWVTKPYETDLVKLLSVMCEDR